MKSRPQILSYAVIGIIAAVSAVFWDQYRGFQLSTWKFDEMFGMYWFTTSLLCLTIWLLSAEKLWVRIIAAIFSALTLPFWGYFILLAENNFQLH